MVKTDAELALLAQNGDEAAAEEMLSRYGDVAISCSKKYYCDGYGADDLAQEATIGLYKAVMTYKPELNDNFLPYAILCIRSKLNTVLEASLRQRHIPQNQCISLDTPVGDGENNIVDLMKSPDDGPEALFMREELILSIENKITAKLSGFEGAVLKEFLENKTYKEIAETLASDVKSVDNAIQRIRKKLKDFL